MKVSSVNLFKENHADMLKHAKLVEPDMVIPSLLVLAAKKVPTLVIYLATTPEFFLNNPETSVTHVFGHFPQLAGIVGAQVVHSDEINEALTPTLVYHHSAALLDWKHRFPPIHKAIIAPHPFCVGLGLAQLITSPTHVICDIGIELQKYDPFQL
jgi:hypothetical protein